MTDTDMQQKLLQRIKARRSDITQYVSDIEPRGTRLTNISIICSAVASVLTAGPALGGTSFTEGIQNILRIADDSPVWRILCLAATLLSVSTVIATNMYKSHDMSTRLSKAQAANALLEGLETQIEFGQMPLQEGAKLYQQYIADVPFIHEKTAP